jgi:hypothetical protein
MTSHKRRDDDDDKKPTKARHDEQLQPAEPVSPQPPQPVTDTVVGENALGQPPDSDKPGE